jgi:hypothetical protein
MPVEPYRVVSALPAGTGLSRYIIAKGLGHGDLYTELEIANRWKDSPQVAATLELRTKAAVGVGTTVDASFAGPLAIHGIAPEALTIERGLSIRGAFEAKMQRVPLRTRVAVETGAGFPGGGLLRGRRFRCKRPRSARSSKSISNTA